MSDNSIIRSGHYQIPSLSNEDRLFEHIALDVVPSSFAVFDGHGGKLCAEQCSLKLHDLILSAYNEISQSHLLETGSVNEAVFCDATKKSIKELDLSIRTQSTTGSTMVSLFVFKRSDGSNRVICSWVGDSRCSMFYRVKNQVEFIAMSEDHKPDLERENKRISERLETPWLGKPLDVKHGVDFSTLLKQENILTKPADYLQTKEGEEEAFTGNIIHQNSFIDHRPVPEGVGFIAVFGRYGISLTTSRSIGDSDGPRSCVCQPDISAVTILPNDHARFVLASDGLWDVLSENKLKSIIYTVEDPTEMAKFLATIAYKKRLARRGLKADDITVIVVDINPSLMTFSKHGSACIIA